MELKDLSREIENLKNEYPKLSNDNLFVLWFLRAFITENLDLSVMSLCGEKSDKGIDAILIDEKAKIVFIIQAKYRQKIFKKLESRVDITDFASLSGKLTGGKDTFSTFIQSATPEVRKKLEEARDRILKRKYSLRLYYATLGKCSKDLEKEAIYSVRQSNCDAIFEIFTGKRILLLLSDYFEGVAPPVPSIELEMEYGAGMRINGPLQRYDSHTDIDSYVFSMSANAIADVFEKCGPRLFARNVRGFLGKSEINIGMEDTLKNQPEYFWYYNNGITIICDMAEIRSTEGKDILHVENPQIINGQQTTRTLHNIVKDKTKASVLIRVIRVPRADDKDREHFENLVSTIVAATNLQNAIRPSDLMSNDRRQIEIERAFRKQSYLYLRKRQSRSEAKADAGGNHFFTIKKEELAQSVAACDLDPFLLRLGKETLFEEHYYKTVFPTSNINYYLNRYWVMKKVTNAAKGYPERAYAKWLVLHFIWKYMDPKLSSASSSKFFQNECKRYSELSRDLIEIADVIFKVAILFYNKKRGRGETANDPSTFFRRKNAYIEFNSFWRSANNTYRELFKKKMNKFDMAFKSINS